MPVKSIFKGLLPKSYRQQWSVIQQYQHFFQAQESDAVFQLVKVANVTSDYLHVTMPNPALANYLRLHNEEIRSLLLESFGHALEIKISSRPEANNEVFDKPKLKPAQHFSDKVCSQVFDAADSVDDERLSAALKSLSKAIKE